MMILVLHVILNAVHTGVAMVCTTAVALTEVLRACEFWILLVSVVCTIVITCFIFVPHPSTGTSSGGDTLYILRRMHMLFDMIQPYHIIQEQCTFTTNRSFLLS